MNDRIHGEPRNALYDGIASILIAAISVARGLPLLLAGRPKTPLRVLCIVAFDALHALRREKRLSMRKLRLLAALLDLGACANAAFDNKAWRRRECRAALCLLERAGMRRSVVEYLRRLDDLERARPRAGGDDCQFQTVRLYREAVVRLSLGMLAATACPYRSLDDAIRATRGEPDLNLLFRIAMQCQIIDDVLDYSKDLSAGLPSFLTASSSLQQALERTRLAALGYAHDRDLPRSGDVFPLRSALFMVSTCARVVLLLGRWRQQARLGRPFAARADAPRGLATDAVRESRLVGKERGRVVLSVAPSPVSRHAPPTTRHPSPPSVSSVFSVVKLSSSVIL